MTEVPISGASECFGPPGSKLRSGPSMSRSRSSGNRRLFDAAIELLDQIDPQLGLPLKLVPQGRGWWSGFFLRLGVEPLDDLLEQGGNRPISTSPQAAAEPRAYIVGAGALFCNLLFRRAVERRLELASGICARETPLSGIPYTAGRFRQRGSPPSPHGDGGLPPAPGHDGVSVPLLLLVKLLALLVELCCRRSITA